MIELRDVTYAYPGADAPCVRGVTLDVAPGEIVAVVGPNGSGKSTLARLAAASLLASGGSVAVDGRDPKAGAAERRACSMLVGLVRQDPQDQIVSSRVFDEVAFGPCNLGLDPAEVRRRVATSLEACGLSGYELRRTDALSGGEQQRLAFAGIVAMGTRYLVADEVTSFLDGPSRAEVRELLVDMAQAGRGVLFVTHEAADVICADRVVLVEDGLVGWAGGVDELLSRADLLARSGMADDMLARVLSPLVAAGLSLGELRDAADEREAAERVAAFAIEHGVAEEAAAAMGALRERRGGVAALGMREASVVFEQGVHALNRCGVAVPAGTVMLMAGPSGSGKSTALRVLAGVLEPDEGMATLMGKLVRPGMVGLSFQRPEEQLFCATVSEEVAFAPSRAGIRGRDLQRRVDEMLEAFGLAALRDRSPFQLSGGQARRVALAAVLSLGADAYVFDEPTAGLDGAGRARLRSLVRELADRGNAVVVVSHDVCEWLRVADDVVLLSHGRDVWEGAPAALMRYPAVLASAGLEMPLALAIGSACARRAPQAWPEAGQAWPEAAQETGEPLGGRGEARP
ncbi:MAG: energy-coupling factor ABC transporter ATP-binding protein [Atopobiaceae bacterium]|jgi:energy-coupling factor transport system ATP-binding protein|nr:energy-coupling factor ABC transporter ATP-binding protein [Atopobiaceae bacterium]MCH4119706.1 energy-coupling factor ABC transporter ATP-binding protein [Atopobiaceae bacterium]MCI1318497.1 energy-coupling factor ABC transporter ATP-binding protein [Atopobiaceae bacterium]MCI1388780.1 energy-coupling factor ABC transporter ATP-binding protein [Atopobiaceae bacterium]MCI1432600.1 energy-coupling factor ABC transporter ATP-binding protein [Atopobiaceae bacterium]